MSNNKTSKGYFVIVTSIKPNGERNRWNFYRHQYFNKEITVGDMVDLGDEIYFKVDSISRSQHYLLPPIVEMTYKI